MSDKDLKGKIFTFDQSLCGKQMDEMVGVEMSFAPLIKNLQSNKGIDEEDMMTFKFFKISRSKVVTYSDEPEKIMLAIVDISQKILYDTSKAQTEMLSLINSSISHEMRNPLNSIINECQIMGILIVNLNQIVK